MTWQTLRTLVFLVLLAPAAALSVGIFAAEPLVTDRPTAGEAAHTVGWQAFQIELGPDLVRDVGDRTAVTSFRTPVKLRYGVTENTEIHLQSAGFASDSTVKDGARDEQTGVADLELGFKSAYSGGGHGPSSGISLTFTIPVGSAPFRAASVVPSARLLFAWPLGFQTSLGANVGVTFLNSNDPRTIGPQVPLFYAVGVGRPLVGPLGGFIEVFGEIPTTRQGEASTSLDGGLVWLLTDDVQLDVALRGGLSDNAPDFGATIGISIRHQMGRGF